uniref:Uncharacterized protein n=1 Tax=viral metagenome TaxID=1070528 RepID=A0A6C0C6H7_9ZZZZ
MLPLLLLLVLSCSADFADTTCEMRKSSLAEMRRVDYAKSLAFGYHNCNTTLTNYNLDGTPNSTFVFPAVVETFYNETTGSIDSTYNPAGTGAIWIKEYSNGNGGVCITIEGNPFYVESYDITTGAKSTAMRVIPMYEKTKNKKLRAIQWLRPTEWGDSLVLVNLDENGRFVSSIFQTCETI